MDFTPYLSALIMLLGIIVGTIINPRIQHEMGGKYNRRELIFERKLKYFEFIIEVINWNRKLYLNILHRLEDSKKKVKVDELAKELKKERKKFSIMASPLYFNIRVLSEKIIKFVTVEKDIFNKIALLKDANMEKRGEAIWQLRKGLKLLSKKNEEILHEMRRELGK